MINFDFFNDNFHFININLRNTHEHNKIINAF